MSTEIPLPSPNDPSLARPVNGMNAQGEAIYQCERCERYKTRAHFGHNEHGRVDSLCSSCRERVGISGQRQRYVKNRDHITITHQVCTACGEKKTADCYWLDAKQKDGLKLICASCTLQKRSPSKERKTPIYEAFTPASAIQPNFDQAIAERDALAAELESLRATTGAMQERLQNQAPRTDLLALNAIETELRWLREQLEQRTEPTASLPRYVQACLAQTATLVGPLAYTIFKWADRQILKEES